MRILISGQNGQVSRELQRRLASLGELVVLGRDQLDLAQPQQIRQQVQRVRPDLIINAAAHTAVDQAESEPELAFAINATGPGVLAEEALALGIPLIHYSTDYVFDGSKNEPYNEADAPNPLGVYGKSKLAGEQAITEVQGQHLILRTSWVYSTHGRNFLLTMQRLLQEKPEMRIVADQIGAPTWAGTIAGSTLALIERWKAGQAGAWGTYHLTAQGETSWFGFAQAIGEALREQGKPCANLLP
ncbi:dTDP-4-dehydrorhamnose reductase, partial [Pseudomonas sp. BGI-2]|uniref:dTDP-4-dehydrorhamnose reductase n=1 Tax=Pseudomonas sp. BGI-2 TaxID=2528211 RepID=UPI00103352BB